MIPTSETLSLAIGKNIEGSDITISFMTGKNYWCSIGVFFTINETNEESDEMPPIESRFGTGVFMSFAKMDDNAQCEYQVITSENMVSLKLALEDDDTVLEFLGADDVFRINDSIDEITRYYRILHKSE